MDGLGRFIVKGFKGDVLIHDGSAITDSFLGNRSFWDPDKERSLPGSKAKRGGSLSQGPMSWTPAVLTFETHPPKGWQLLISRGDRGSGAKPFVVSAGAIEGVELRGPGDGESSFRILKPKPGAEKASELEQAAIEGVVSIAFRATTNSKDPNGIVGGGSIDFVHASLGMDRSEKWVDTIMSVMASHKKISSIKSENMLQLVKKAEKDPDAKVDVGFGSNFQQSLRSCSVVLKFTGSEFLCGVKSAAKNQESGVSRQKWRFNLTNPPEVTATDDWGNVQSFTVFGIPLPEKATIAKSTELCADIDSIPANRLEVSVPRAAVNVQVAGQFVHSFYTLLTEYSSGAEGKIKGYTAAERQSSQAAFMQDQPSTIFRLEGGADDGRDTPLNTPNNTSRSNRAGGSDLTSPLGTSAISRNNSVFSERNENSFGSPRSPRNTSPQRQNSSFGVTNTATNSSSSPARVAQPQQPSSTALSAQKEQERRMQQQQQLYLPGGDPNSIGGGLKQQYPQQSWGAPTNPVLRSLLRSLNETEYFTRQLFESNALETLISLRTAARITGPSTSSSSYLTEVSPNRLKLMGVSEAGAGAAASSGYSPTFKPKPLQSDEGVDPVWKDARSKVNTLLKIRKHREVVQMITELHEREKKIFVHRR